MLGTFKLGEITTVKTWDDGTFRHDEANASIVLKSAKSGQSMICILSDDTDVLSFLCIGWKTCSARNRWSTEMDQYLKSITPVLILARNAYTQLLRYNFLPLPQRKDHCSEYYDMLKLPEFGYYR